MKVATVFSGIGAIEHALQTIGIPHEIVFACDNGDINPFDLKIKKSFASIYNSMYIVFDKIFELNVEEIKNNHATLNIEEKKRKIEREIHELEKYHNELQEKIYEDEYIVNVIKNINPTILSPSLAEEWEFLKKNNLVTVDFLDDYFKHLQRKGLNQEKEHDLIKGIKKTSLYREINNLMNKIVLEINMLNEQIETEIMYSKLNKLENFREKKKLVDDLYNASSKKNYVYESYKANYKISDDHFHQDARFVDGNFYKNKVDLFVGGSPCQSFSMVGHRRGLDDTRGTLFYEYARLIKEIQPKVFIYENVKGLLSHDKGETWKTIQQVFDDLGYFWNTKIMNSKDYGIPQNRERIFVVGFRKDLQLEKPFEFPEKIPLTTTMQDFLTDNVSGKYYLNRKGVEFVTDKKNIQKRFTQINGEIQLCQKANQQFNWHGDFIFVEEERGEKEVSEDLEKYFLSQKVEEYVMSSGTKNFYSKPEIDLEIARPLLTTMHKMHRAGVDNYVTTSGRIRKLTPRESLRLMGFCDSFKIVVSDTQIYRQAGNSIVVNVLVHLLKSICESLPILFKQDSYKTIDKIKCLE